MAPLVTLAISMHVRCAACESSIHLGAVVDRARCPKCGAIEQLPPRRWRGLLDGAVNDGPNLQREDAQIVHDDDNAWVVTEARVPKCASCGQLLPATAAENARKHGRCFCVGCGAKIHVRAVPAAFAEVLPRITHLLGEDGGQLKSPDAPNAPPSDVVSVRCPDCGGNIQPDGRSHAVRCPYCSVVVVLPQAIWARFARSNDPHVYYLVHDPSLPRPLGRADVSWSSLDDLVTDPQGNLYGMGTDGGVGGGDDRMVFALDRQLRTLWVTKSLPIDDTGAIAWRNDGVILAWSEQRYSAILLRASDGQQIGTIGGEQPRGLDRHVLDLSRAESLAIDTDGTILFSKRDRLVRCASDGSAQLTWPPAQGLFAGLRSEKLEPFTDADAEGAEDLENAGDRPTKLYDVEVHVGWDGRTYLRRSEYLACYDRSGKKHWGVTIAREHGYLNDHGADARGIVYVLASLESDTSQVLRVVGGQVTPFIDGRNPATPIRDERRLAVFPDGTLVLGSGGRELRIFSPDGRLLHLTDDAAEEDRRVAKQRLEDRRADKVR